MAVYLSALYAELGQWGRRLGRVPVESVFFGGGTPSLLDPDQLEGVLDCAGRTFEVLPGAEISMEANPDSLHTAEKASGFLAAGVNRISLGVQSLHDGMLETLGRLHRANAAREAFRAIREAGCANLSLDLMWGLPGQTLEQWLEDARAAIALGPEHISAYGLTLEPGTPLAESCGDAELPSEDVQCAMYLEGIRLFEEAGLHHYELSNFARDGFRCRHNLGYWEGRDYLGVGPAATSTIGGERWTNPEGEGWLEQVREGRRCPEREPLDRATRALELMMLRLRTVDGLPLDAYESLAGRSFLVITGRSPTVSVLRGWPAWRTGCFGLRMKGCLFPTVSSVNFLKRNPKARNEHFIEEKRNVPYNYRRGDSHAPPLAGQG